MNSNFNYVFSKLKKMCKNTYKNVKLCEISSFKIGGRAKVLVEPGSLEEIIKIMDFISSRNIKYFVVGNCTNLLFADTGYNGVIIKISSAFSHIEKIGNSIIVDAGVSLNAVTIFATENGLKGMEDAIGIPGAVGGAVSMNAGAYDFKISNTVKSVVALVDGKIKLLNNAECKFGYRQSMFKNMECIILRVEFALQKGKKIELKQRQTEIMERRKSNQPLSQPSAGCVFKNPDGISVARLIEQQGLKGYSIGGAMVSTKHSNFIVNSGGASSSDVLRLIEHIKNEIKINCNIELETEIIIVN